MLFPTPIHTISVDCPDIIQLAYGLNMHLIQPLFMSELQTDCCTKVGCISGRVTYISWTSKGLNGSINATALPSSLTNLFLWDNKLTGGLPNPFPPNQQYFDVSTNFLSGSIPCGLPATLEYLHLQINNFNGTLVNFPNVMFSLVAHYNSFSGSLPNPLPLQLTALEITGNLLTGSLPDPLPAGLSYFHAYSNLMSGNLPKMPFAMNSLGLSSGNKFTGKLELQQPADFSVADMFINDIIVHNTSFLTNCDISNNPLLGNSNILNLTVCTQNGLFTPSIASFTSIASKLTATSKFRCPNTFVSLKTSLVRLTSTYSTLTTIQNPKTQLTTTKSTLTTTTMISKVASATKLFSFPLFQTLTAANTRMYSISKNIVLASLTTNSQIYLSDTITFTSTSTRSKELMTFNVPAGIYLINAPIYVLRMIVRCFVDISILMFIIVRNPRWKSRRNAVQFTSRNNKF